MYILKKGEVVASVNGQEVKGYKVREASARQRH
jgi:hypothetical protein